MQTDDYYPFGMSMSSYQRENSLLNKFLYNGGAEKQSDIDANIYSMFFRGVDVSIGRMMQVDPMADKYSSLSPYNYAFNDPVYWNDVSGATPEEERLARENKIANDRNIIDKMLDNNRRMYGVIGDDDLNGGESGWGVKFGPGDGGALGSYVDYMLEGSHAAKDRAENIKTGTEGLLAMAWGDTPDNALRAFGVSGGGVWERYTLQFNDAPRDDNFYPYPPSLDLISRFSASFIKKIIDPMSKLFAGKSVNAALLSDIETVLKVIADGLDLRDNNSLIPYDPMPDGFPNPWSYKFSIQLVSYIIDGYGYGSSPINNIQNHTYRPRFTDNVDDDGVSYGDPYWTFSFPAYPGRVEIYLLYNAIPSGN